MLFLYSLLGGGHTKKSETTLAIKIHGALTPCIMKLRLLSKSATKVVIIFEKANN